MRASSSRKQFVDLSAAKTWQQDARPAVRKGELKAPTRLTVQQVGDELIVGMESGAILDRSGTRFKPSTIRGYRQALRDYIYPTLGHVRLSNLDRARVQALVNALNGHGLAPSTVRNILNPLQVICREHVETIGVNPTLGLRLPEPHGKRDTIASPEYAQLLIEALPEAERALWATAFYAGLRIGELRALRWSDVDLDGYVLNVRRGWDDQEGEQAPKSDAGEPSVPLAGPLRIALEAHRARTGRGADDLVFGRTATLPFTRSTIRTRARDAWNAAGLRPLTPHEARHCAASYLIAAGLNAKELSQYIGHSDIRTTYNRYGHLMPGSEVAAARRLTEFLTADRGESRVKVSGRAERTPAESSGEEIVALAGKARKRWG